MKIFWIHFVLFFCSPIFAGVVFGEILAPGQLAPIESNLFTEPNQPIESNQLAAPNQSAKYHGSKPKLKEAAPDSHALATTSPSLEKIVSQITKAGFPADRERGSTRTRSVSLESQRFWYLRSLANYDKNWRKLKKEGPWETLSVRKPADYLYAMASVELFFRECPELRVDYSSERVFPPEDADEMTKLIRQMQDLSPDSPFRGNFRWYWFQKTVEDRNAVEFVVKRLLFCWFHRMTLPQDCHESMIEILRDAAPECRRRMVKPDYSNIAVLNFSNLILLGEALDEPDLKQEGIQRMNRFLFQTWESGIFEFSTPTYFNEMFEALEQLKNLTQDQNAREKSELLLDYLALLTAVHWTEDGRFSGACSRTYSYLFGDIYLQRHVGAWGWSALPNDRSDVTILTALNGKYAPPEWLEELRNVVMSSEKVVVCERWGKKSLQQKKTLRTPFFSHGISGAQYGSRQDLLWTVDWKKTGPEDKNPRCFFMPDGRNDPWGISLQAGGGGHRKALHLNPDWRAELLESETENASGTTTLRSRASCQVVYSEKLLQQFQQENPENRRTIQSVFVLKKPDSFDFQGRNQLVTHYENQQMTLTVTNLSQGKIASTLQPSPDGTAVAWTIAHDVQSTNQINLEFEAEILSPQSSEIQESSLEESNGENNAPQRKIQKYSQTSDDEILTVNGLALGKIFLESRLASLKNFSEEQKKLFGASPDSLPVVSLNPGESSSFPAIRGLFFQDFISPDGNAVTIQNATVFRFRIEKPGKFRLAAYVLAPDEKHDSLQLTYWTPNQPMGTHFPCWALDSSTDWRWVEFRTPNPQSPPVELNLSPGIFTMKLEPREFNVQLQTLRFTRIE